MVGMRAAAGRGRTLFGDPLHLPGTRHITPQLVIGSVLFGAGWAIAGLCPGPAIVALGAGYLKAAIFVTAMLAGMLVHKHLLGHHHV